MSDPDFTPQAFLLDMDGVLVHSHELHLAAYETAFRQHGLRLYDEARELVRRGTARDRVLSRSGISEDLVGPVSEAKEAAFTELLTGPGIEPAPGARRFVERIRATGCPMAVVSNSASAQDCLRALDMTDDFDVVVDVTMVDRPKPDAEPWLLAAERLDVSPARCCAVEDSTTGARSARAAGTFVIGVGDRLDPGDVDLLVPELDDVPVKRWMDHGEAREREALP